MTKNSSLFKDKSCPLCKLPTVKANLLKRQYILGKIPIEKICEEYNLSVEQVNEHFYYHKILDEETISGDGIDYYYEIIKDIINRFNTWFKLISQENDLSQSTLKQAATIARELRDTMRFMAELEQRVGSGGKSISETKYKNLQERYEKIKAILMNDICDNCSDKVFERLEREKLIK